MTSTVWPIVFGAWLLICGWILYLARHVLARAGSADKGGQRIRKGLLSYGSQLKGAIIGAAAVVFVGLIFVAAGLIGFLTTG